MSTEGSVTAWIAHLKTGDDAAVQHLWEKYFPQMVELAHRRLEHAPRRAADEEDVALSAFNSFCQRARAGYLPRLSDRNDLWSLLVAITAHKSIDLIRHENRQKRRHVGYEAEALESLLSTEPTPDFALHLADRLEQLLARLDATGDAELRRIALWKLEGASTAEIADRLKCVRRTVERKANLIARVWEREDE